MTGRLGALVLALIVGAAPASLTVCELACAAPDSHGSHGAGATPHHSCHDTQPKNSTTSVTGGLHDCGHGDQLPSAAGSLSSLDMVAPVTVVGGSASFVAQVSAGLAAIIGSSPGRLAVTTPLRI